MQRTWRCNSTGGTCFSKDSLSCCKIDSGLPQRPRSSAVMLVVPPGMTVNTGHSWRVDALRTNDIILPEPYHPRQQLPANQHQHDESIDRSVNLKRIRYFPAGSTGYPGNHSLMASLRLRIRPLRGLKSSPIMAAAKASLSIRGFSTICLNH